MEKKKDPYWEGKKEIRMLLSREETDKIAELSKISGLPYVALVRKLIREAKIEPKINPDIRNLVRSVERIGNDMRQIMHFAGQTGQISKEKIEESEHLIQELKEEVRRWL